jgi:hypothetical protein
MCKPVRNPRPSGQGRFNAMASRLLARRLISPSETFPQRPKQRGSGLAKDCLIRL